MAIKQPITIEQLREVLVYDPETGKFSWAKPEPKTRKRGGQRRETPGAIYTTNGYSRIFIYTSPGRKYCAHQLAWLYMTGTWPQSEVRHINEDCLDNRWCNLILASELDDEPLTQERLREILHYDPDTGQFRWVKKGKSRRETVGCIYERRNGDDVRMKIGIGYNRYPSQQVAWLWMTGELRTDIDHKDGNPLNNKWSNLRIATGQQQKQNHKKYKNNKSGYTGVWWSDRREKYQVKVSNKTIGYFEDIEVAHETYELTSRNMFGEFKREEQYQ